MIRRAEIVNANHLYTLPITGNYTVKGSEDIILADATAGAITVTLPDATANKNLAIYVKKTDSGGNAVTVATSLSQTIDGASTVSLAAQYATTTLVSDGANWIVKTVSASGTFTGGTITGATTVSLASATALVVGPNGTTNPTFQVDTNTASAATGIKITGAAAGGKVALAVISSGTNEDLTIDSKGSGNIRMGTGSTGSVAIARPASVSIANANALAVGANGTTNPVLKVDSATASQATGISITGAAAAGGVAVAVISSGTNENLTINAKGTGVITVQSAIAVPAGGSAAASFLMSSTANLGIYFGSGAPTVTAAQGSVYIRTDGSSTSTRLYVNTTGSTTWTNVTTAA